MDDHSQFTTFLRTKDPNAYIFQQNYLTVAHPHLIPFFLTRVKRNLSKQTIFCKRNCDSETGLKNSFIIETET